MNSITPFEMANKLILKHFKKENSWSCSVDLSSLEVRRRIGSLYHDTKKYGHAYVFWVQVQKELEYLKF